MDLLHYILAGAAVGFAVGVTGVGGGSLMTPLLLLFGFPAHIAIGTDLLYAAITKSGGAVMHRRLGTIRWDIVLKLGAGSIIASIVTVIGIKYLFDSPDDYSALLTSTLGIMLMMTSFVLLFKRKIQCEDDTTASTGWRADLSKRAGAWTVVMGVVLGVLVTLSSVGAGALGAAILMTLYPKLSTIKIVGTDLAHAVPLTLVAGIGHMFLGNVDYGLLISLLIGSMPAIYLGTKVATKIPENVLRPILASTLLGLGVKYTFF